MSDTKHFDYLLLDGIQEISYLLVAYRRDRRYHHEYERKMIRVQRRGKTMKQIKKKSQRALKRSIVKSNRNMAKGVEGCAWCKNKSTEARPIMKNIFEMVILAVYKDVPSLEL